MGQEIEQTHFRSADFAAFGERLRNETALLHDWFRDAAFSRHDRVGGFELEAWLIDPAGRPAAVNEPFLAQLNDPRVVPELARFNIELNAEPQALRGDALSRMQAGLQAIFRSCQAVAAGLDAQLVTIGILPTLCEKDLTLANMSCQRRYRALNEQVLRERKGEPMHLDIHGREHLKIAHRNVMLEAAATSFQIHIKVAPERAVHCYNLAQILSAPMVAVSANSPFLFGHDLWCETRIPLFEQAVQLGGFADAAHGPLRRVGFGSGYVRDSLFECFQENQEHFPVLLPMCTDAPPERLAHLRLHNGTIWRWNRPLIGFDADGAPHVRIEHRVIPGGPTLTDSIADAALFFGLMQSLGDENHLTGRLPFAQARDNFYAAARDGLDAQVRWLDDRRGAVQALVLNELLPLARRGLERLEMDAADVEHFLGVMQSRVETARTGTAWQRNYVARHGRDWQSLILAYRAHQETGRPVHEWPQ